MPHDDRAWTAEEEQRLLHMKNVLRFSYRKMDQELGRTRDSMQQRLKKLKHAGTFVRIDAGNPRSWPAELDDVVLDMRVKAGRKYVDIAAWLNAQGVVVTMAQVKNSIRHRLVKRGVVLAGDARRPRDLRPPYEPGHGVTWGALNSLLPNCGPLHYTPGI